LWNIHAIFNETNNGLASAGSFDEFQLSKYVNDEDKGETLLLIWTKAQIMMTKGN